MTTFNNTTITLKQLIMKKHIILVMLALITCAGANAQKYLGGDISLLPTYREKGTTYKTAEGKETCPYKLFTEAGWNAMRVRLFVEPDNAPQGNKDEGVCQDLPYVIKLCKQIKAHGFKLMLDFHYSDTWADPGKQFTPKAWDEAIAGKSKDEQVKILADSVYTHTLNALNALKQAGAEPDFIQVGNEITFGMLWPTGRVEPTKADNWPTLLTLLNAGVKACRQACPKAQIIIHTEHAQDWNATEGYYAKLRDGKLDYDIIGLSYYPMWHGTIKHLDVVLDSLKTTFNKPVMIVETAFYYSHENDIWEKDPNHYSDLYPISAEGQRRFTEELVTMLNKHDDVTGLFWWFPEENESGSTVVKSWLNRGLFDNHTGKTLPSMDEFSKFIKQ